MTSKGSVIVRTTRASFDSLVSWHHGACTWFQASSSVACSGYWLDKWLGTYPWCAGVGLIVGIGRGFRNIWLDARILLRQRQDDAKKRQPPSIGWKRGPLAERFRTPSGNPLLADQRHRCLLIGGGLIWFFHPAGVAVLVWLRALLSAWNFAFIKFVLKLSRAVGAKEAFCPSPHTNMRLLFYRNFVVHGSGTFQAHLGCTIGPYLLLVGMTAED